MSVRPATVVALLALLATGCGAESEADREREEAEARQAVTKECSEAGDLDAEPERQPPDDVTIVDGAHVYESEEPQGKTEQFLAAADGDAGEMEAERDAAADALVSSGYKLLSSDQEEGPRPRRTCRVRTRSTSRSCRCARGS